MIRRHAEAENKVVVGVILTKDEVENLVSGDVVTGKGEGIFIQVVGYGEK